ncbi:hypothetical protein OROMI_004083 [Orobanche minor]
MTTLPSPQRHLDIQQESFIFTPLWDAVTYLPSFIDGSSVSISPCQ